MKLIKEIRENGAILTLKGEFDSFVCNPFMEEVNALYKNDIKYLVVDMRLLLFINSTAIGMLVKIHKETKKQGGALVLCRPSNFVSGVLDSLGLTSLFKMSEDPEKALDDLLSSDKGMEMGGEGSVLIHLSGGKKDKFVGKMTSLDEESMEVRIPEAGEALTKGLDCKVKFRLPLFRKGHYFEVQSTITRADLSEKGAFVKCRFKSMKEDVKKSITQFVEEMTFLRDEARKDS